MKHQLIVLFVVGGISCGYAQRWSIEPTIATRFDRNELRVIQGDIQTEPHRSVSFGVEVNRHPHPRLYQGIGFSRHSFGNSYIIEGTYSNVLRLGSAFYFLNTLTFHHTYQFIKLRRYEFEAGAGGQFFFTEQMNGRSGGAVVGQPSTLRPFDIVEEHSAKRGLSPVGFARLNMRYRIRPSFSSFFRTQLNVGTRQLYTTNLFYTGRNTAGSGTVKNRGTGVAFVFGVRLEIEKQNK